MGWYYELDSARSSNGFGPNPISYAEMLSWSRLTKTPLKTWEVLIIRRIDNAYLAFRARTKPRRQTTVPPPPPRVSRG